MTDFRAALQKLLNEVHDLRLEAGNPSLRSAVTEARAALAEQPVAPTDEEILLWADQLADETLMGSSDDDWIFDVSGDDLLGFARAVLARWGCQ
jgi:hypothetical protein